MAETDSKLVQGVLSLGEERMGEVVAQLLANDSFVAAMQGAIATSLAAKKRVDQSAATLLGVAGVPTLDDLAEVRGRLDELEGSLGDIEDRIVRMMERVQAERAPKPKAKKKAASKTKAAKKPRAKKKHAADD